MKRAAVAVVVVLFFVAAVTFAGSVKTYQVTGPVLEIKDTTIVVQKGKDKWEIAKDANTKIKGDLKVGAKVTIQYEMKATDIEVKAK